MSGFCFTCCDNTHLNEKEYEINTQIIPYNNQQYNFNGRNQEKNIFNHIKSPTYQTQPIVKPSQPNQNQSYPDLKPKLSSIQQPDIHPTTSLLMGSVHNSTIQDSIILGKFDNLMYDAYASIKKQQNVQQSPAKPQQPITPINNIKPIVNPIQPITTFVNQQQYQQPRMFPQPAYQPQGLLPTPQYFPRINNNIYTQPLKRF